MNTSDMSRRHWLKVAGAPEKTNRDLLSNQVFFSPVRRSKMTVPARYDEEVCVWVQLNWWNQAVSKEKPAGDVLTWSSIEVFNRFLEHGR